MVRRINALDSQIDRLREKQVREDTQIENIQEELRERLSRVR